MLVAEFLRSCQTDGKIDGDIIKLLDVGYLSSSLRQCIRIIATLVGKWTLQSSASTMTNDFDSLEDVVQLLHCYSQALRLNKSISLDLIESRFLQVMVSIINILAQINDENNSEVIEAAMLALSTIIDVASMQCILELLDHERAFLNFCQTISSLGFEGDAAIQLLRNFCRAFEQIHISRDFNLIKKLCVFNVKHSCINVLLDGIDNIDNRRISVYIIEVCTQILVTCCNSNLDVIKISDNFSAITLFKSLKQPKGNNFYDRIRRVLQEISSTNNDTDIFPFELTDADELPTRDPPQSIMITSLLKCIRVLMDINPRNTSKTIMDNSGGSNSSRQRGVTAVSPASRDSSLASAGINVQSFASFLWKGNSSDFSSSPPSRRSVTVTAKHSGPQQTFDSSLSFINQRAFFIVVKVLGASIQKMRIGQTITELAYLKFLSFIKDFVSNVSRKNYGQLHDTQYFLKILNQIMFYSQIVQEEILDLLFFIIVELDLIPTADLSTMGWLLQQSVMNQDTANIILEFLNKLLLQDEKYKHIFQKTGIFDACIVLLRSKSDALNGTVIESPGRRNVMVLDRSTYESTLNCLKYMLSDRFENVLMFFEVDGIEIIFNLWEMNHFEDAEFTIFCVLLQESLVFIEYYSKTKLKKQEAHRYTIACDIIEEIARFILFKFQRFMDDIDLLKSKMLIRYIGYVCQLVETSQVFQFAFKENQGIEFVLWSIETIGDEYCAKLSIDKPHENDVKHRNDDGAGDIEASFAEVFQKCIDLLFVTTKGNPITTVSLEDQLKNSRIFQSTIVNIFNMKHKSLINMNQFILECFLKVALQANNVTLEEICAENIGSLCIHIPAVVRGLLAVLLNYRITTTLLQSYLIGVYNLIRVDLRNLRLLLNDGEVLGRLLTCYQTLLSESNSTVQISNDLKSILTKLLETVSLYKIKTSDLIIWKSLIVNSSSHSESEDAYSDIKKQMLRILVRVATNDNGVCNLHSNFPHFTFDQQINGFSSIEIPKLLLKSSDTWPPVSTGYTFSTWFCFDQLDTSQHLQRYETLFLENKCTLCENTFDSEIIRLPDCGHVFCKKCLDVRSKNCSGGCPICSDIPLHLLHIHSNTKERDTSLLIYIINQKLYVATSKKSSVVFEDFHIQEKEWYHIGITHARTRFRGPSNISLYINGIVVETHKLSFPGSIQFPSAYIGTPTIIKFKSPLKFKVGPIYLTQDCWSAESMAAFYCLRPQYDGVFHGFDGFGKLKYSRSLLSYEHIRNIASAQAKKRMKELIRDINIAMKPTSVIFALSPRRVHFASKFQHYSAQKNQQSNSFHRVSEIHASIDGERFLADGGKHHSFVAKMIGDVDFVSSHYLSQAVSLTAYSGIPFVFEIVSASTSPTTLNLSLSLLRASLLDSNIFGETFEKEHGYEALAHIIEFKAIDGLLNERSIALLFTIIGLGEELRGSINHVNNVDVGDIISNILACKYLILNWNIWGRLESSLQEFYFHLLLHSMENFSKESITRKVNSLIFLKLKLIPYLLSILASESLYEGLFPIVVQTMKATTVTYFGYEFVSTMMNFVLATLSSKFTRCATPVGTPKSNTGTWGHSISSGKHRTRILRNLVLEMLIEVICSQKIDKRIRKAVHIRKVFFLLHKSVNSQTVLCGMRLYAILLQHWDRKSLETSLYRNLFELLPHSLPTPATHHKPYTNELYYISFAILLNRIEILKHIRRSEIVYNSPGELLDLIGYTPIRDSKSTIKYPNMIEFILQLLKLGSQEKQVHQTTKRKKRVESVSSISLMDHVLPKHNPATRDERDMKSISSRYCVDCNQINLCIQTLAMLYRSNLDFKRIWLSDEALITHLVLLSDIFIQLLVVTGESNSPKSMSSSSSLSSISGSESIQILSNIEAIDSRDDFVSGDRDPVSSFRSLDIHMRMKAQECENILSFISLIITDALFVLPKATEHNLLTYFAHRNASSDLILPLEHMVWQTQLIQTVMANISNRLGSQSSVNRKCIQNLEEFLKFVWNKILLTHHSIDTLDIGGSVMLSSGDIELHQLVLQILSSLGYRSHSNSSISTPTATRSRLNTVLDIVTSPSPDLASSNYFYTLLMEIIIHLFERISANDSSELPWFIDALASNVADIYHHFANVSTNVPTNVNLLDFTKKLLPYILKSISNQDDMIRSAALVILKTVMKYSQELFDQILDSSSLNRSVLYNIRNNVSKLIEGDSLFRESNDMNSSNVHLFLEWFIDNANTMNEWIATMDHYNRERIVKIDGLLKSKWTKIQESWSQLQKEAVQKQNEFLDRLKQSSRDRKFQLKPIQEAYFCNYIDVIQRDTDNQKYGSRQCRLLLTPQEEYGEIDGQDAIWTLDATEGPFRMKKRLIRKKIQVSSLKIKSVKFPKTSEDDTTCANTGSSVAPPVLQIDVGNNINIFNDATPPVVALPPVDVLSSSDSLSRFSSGMDVISIADDRISTYSTESDMDIRDTLDDDDTDVPRIDDKLKPLLYPGDTILYSFNCSRILGMDKVDSILLICSSHMYCIDHMQIRKTFHGDMEVIETLHHSKQSEIQWNFLMMSDSNPDLLNLEVDTGEEITSKAVDLTALKTNNKSNNNQGSGENIPSRWRYMNVTEIHNRRHLLRHVALEIFLNDGQNALLAFESRTLRDEILDILLLKCPKVTENITVADAAGSEANDWNKKVRVSRLLSLLNRWQTGHLSNYDYLIALNTLAGRSYNDLTQYPVFPWVLCDYDSEELDLKDPSIYRDLSKPMGAMTEARREEFEDRYEALNDVLDELNPPFHYGTHYSSSAIVLLYLLRLMPFTEQHLRLQAGKFDEPDRLFQSLKNVWLSASGQGSNVTGSTTQDVRELIPEFFYLPDFLENKNGFNMGVTQNNVKVNHVELPPWAKGNTREFIRIHRAALESEHVSKNLHKWIDLIFGYKQVGEVAKEALNVFYYLTYEGKIDLDEVPIHERQAKIDQIKEYGQTPSQLYASPHPPRKVWKPALHASGEGSGGSSSMERKSVVQKFFSAMKPAESDLPSLIEYPDRIEFSHLLVSPIAPSINTAISTSISIGKIIEAPGGKVVYLPEQCAFLKTHSSSASSHGSSSGKDVQFLDFNHSNEFTRRCSAGKIHGHYGKSEILSIHESVCDVQQIITAVEITSDGNTLITSTGDGTILVWKIHKCVESASYMFHLKSTLSVHASPVHILAVSQSYSLIISASKLGRIVVWDLNKCCRIRDMMILKDETTIVDLKINDFTGDICIATLNKLFLCNINGAILASINITESKVSCIAMSEGPEWYGKNLLFSGHDDGYLLLWEIMVSSERGSKLPFKLIKIKKLSSKRGKMSKITKIMLTSDLRYMYAGDVNGGVAAFHIPPPLQQK